MTQLCRKPNRKRLSPSQVKVVRHMFSIIPNVAFRQRSTCSQLHLFTNTNYRKHSGTISTTATNVPITQSTIGVARSDTSQAISSQLRGHPSACAERVNRLCGIYQQAYSSHIYGIILSRRRRPVYLAALESLGRGAWLGVSFGGQQEPGNCGGSGHHAECHTRLPGCSYKPLLVAALPLEGCCHCFLQLLIRQPQSQLCTAAVPVTCRASTAYCCIRALR